MAANAKTLSEPPKKPAGKAPGNSPGKDAADPPFAGRQSRLARAIADKGLDALLVTNPKDVGYLTGFLGGDSYLLCRAAASASGSAPAPTLISDFRYKEELEPVESAGLARVHIRSRSMVEAVCEVLEGAPKATVGVQGEQMTLAERASIQRRSKRKLAETIGLLSELRIIKDESEVALIRKAVKIQESALDAVLPTIKPGQSELDIAARLEFEMKVRGSSEPGFQTIIAAGAAGSLPHYRPTGAKIKAGKPLLIDWGAVFRGYHADMTRTFTLGKWPEKVREIYDIVLEAHTLAARAIAPGKTTVEIDKIARMHIARRGYAEFFGHGLGHGIGLNGHEEPRLTNMLAARPLRAGMVVTIEPGIYLPGVGGVRIEDDYLITETGATCLCRMKKDADWAVL
ncbi:MAG: aminopeptidase P family protein [Phycisphaeraceae bacterium]|nr:aminopeptidase P family protein [Phycisphaeraceae bacterium]